MLQAAIDKSQQFVSGSVRLKLYKGNVGVVGRQSKYSLYDQDLVTFDEGKVASTSATPKASSASTRCGCARSAAEKKAKTRLVRLKPTNGQARMPRRQQTRRIAARLPGK